ncbi:hypothetical protein Salat_1511800 [Sesamum alatum]|uniref:Pollen Ole e 1 allergen and extensin family protein n=1 Tax=Sesamum alatum TaxID=300844 RepID=A0AAE1YC51_9LAMI|nr:hypothetical protein Salat_1511400 [Sesamum alatum]KAK4427426.1 hypothetical protein Salat_1511500 [Sesamum alatum]KAK4427427.1 hypothetical protein Salat_1511600 [Sesamum alatum]KAK4427428.1 hypothetical protein Salat_1511700 [Sesamum alatum]KAK4427429.1 hypothetical protein Salat_1511800 [Sesamum alatum]
MALPSTLLLITLLSIGFTVSYAQGDLAGFAVGGVIFCPNTSLAAVGTYRVVPQATVDVVCGRSQSVVRSTTTNSAGIFSFFFNRVETLLFNLEECQIRVILPPGSCVFVPPGGSIRYTIISIRNRLGIVNAYILGAPTYVLA